MNRKIFSIVIICFFSLLLISGFAIADKPELVGKKQAERALKHEAKKPDREADRELNKTERAAKKAEREIDRETEKLKRGSEKELRKAERKAKKAAKKAEKKLRKAEKSAKKKKKKHGSDDDS